MVTSALAGAACALALGLACLPPPAGAEPPPFPDFSARRVTPPSDGASRRITVQIGPRANPAVPPPPGTTPGTTPGTAPETAAGTGMAGVVRAAPVTDTDWFWNRVSPALADGGPGRLAPALEALSHDPGGTGPRLADLHAVARAHGPQIMLHSVGTQVSPAFALAVIAVESAGRPDAVSRAGAQGLMQLMPATADAFDVADPFDAGQNIAGGIAFLDRLIARFDSDPVLVLAAYNAGETALAEAGGVPAFAETRAYVPKVLAAFRDARALCVTPPELISDGCVLRR